MENYPELDPYRLAVQLEMMRQQNWELTSVNVVATKRLSVDPVIQKMFDQIEQLVRLLLTIPSSSAEAEDSFSSLRRLKSYLRSHMKQNRLNHLTVLYVHKDKLDTLGVDEVAKAFIAKCDSRHTIFGHL